MKGWRDFDIDIFKLSNKKHEYRFDLGSSFFSYFEDSFLEKGELQVDITIDKSDALIIAEFATKGKVEIICDRSLEPFDLQIDAHNKIIFKYGDELAELTDEIISIPRDAQKINIAQYIYEFIGLAIPMKKLHPRFQNEAEENKEEETLLIYSTGQEESDKDTGEDDIDPRWKILNGLKHNNN